MARGGGTAGLFTLLAALAAGPVAAQQVVDAVPQGEFREVYDEVPDTSGGQLLGLRLVGDGGAARGSGPVFVETGGGEQRVCVRVHTRDGRYRATNPFAVPVADARWVRIASLTQQYRDTLDRYDATAVAVRSYLTSDADCSPSDALNLPVVAAPGAVSSVLEAQVNAGGLAVSAQLFPGVEVVPGTPPVATATCGPAGDGARIAYNIACRLSLAGVAPGPGLLRISFDDGFSNPEILDVRVLLPDGAAQ